MDFTDAVIKTLSDRRKGLVFLLWGKFAQEKQALIDETRHHVLKAAHPSPFSADKGFFGCRHFSRANALLAQEGTDPIDWKIEPPANPT
jgi:uracil-DNA glycosylase